MIELNATLYFKGIVFPKKRARFRSDESWDFLWTSKCFLSI